MSDRKAELERKKAKLQAIRDEKERRRREKEQKDGEDAALGMRAAATGPSGDRENLEDLDQMLSSFGVAPMSDVLSSLSSLKSIPSEQSITSIQETPSLTPSDVGQKKSLQNLQIYSVSTTNIPPMESVTYTKQTQTDTSTPSHKRDAQAADYYQLTYDDPPDEESSLPPHLEGGFQSKLPPGILPYGLPQVKEVPPALTSLETQATVKKIEVRDLSEEEKQMLILSEDFQRFFYRSSQLMERALGESIDIYADYAGNPDLEDGGDKWNARLSLNRHFYDERWTRNRCVTSLDWSPQFSELLLASYNSNELYPHDPDGICLVWNTKFKKTTPEYIFHCQSAVMTATFAKFHPNLILGGTYSGQIVLWDNRVQKRTPIQRTSLSTSAHTHPVYCVSVVGTPNAHNLISISTDGRLCSWSLDMLSAPQETLELQHKQGKAVAATCLAFPANDVNNFVVGSEDSAVYSACRHGVKAGVTEMFEGHQGPVTGISSHAAQGNVDFSHLFLTSSFDWTVKLWSSKETKPLYSFEDNGEYVLDVAWSPVHPSLFATVDTMGRLDLWDLNRDTEVPYASVTVEGGPALNRVAFLPGGHHVAAGDDQGRVWIYDVNETVAQPRHDEWGKFFHTLQELKNNQADEEVDKLSLNRPTSR